MKRETSRSWAIGNKPFSSAKVLMAVMVLLALAVRVVAWNLNK